MRAAMALRANEVGCDFLISTCTWEHYNRLRWYSNTRRSHLGIYVPGATYAGSQPMPPLQGMPPKLSLLKVKIR